MIVKFLGHACFLITSNAGLKVMLDPYEAGAFGGSINYAPIRDTADIVLISHDHADHNYVRGVPGSPKVCRQGCDFQGVEFRGVQACHDPEGGTKRGHITVFSFTLDDVRVCHLGDLGTTLTPEQIAAIGPVDVLLIPVGGTYTLDPSQAWAVVEQLKPRLVIPMHFKTAKVNMPLSPVEAFVAGKPNVEFAKRSTVTITPENLSDSMRVLVLEPAN
jgi:L-ascorbate metabolism protein UlaG (beta-lactamase superfamily)